MSGEPKTCVFCGKNEKLTREHVFGDWISRIGVAVPECRNGAGPLNRSLRDLGRGRPWSLNVRDVCGDCNNGWMSRLESVGRRVLTPLIFGTAGTICREDAAALAVWTHKTSLVGMLVSSSEERARGYGVPPAEYRALQQQQAMALPGSQFWIGRYAGRQRFSAIWVTPVCVDIIGHADPSFPHGYVMTVVLGEVLLHGVRFTTPGLDLPLSVGQVLVPLSHGEGAVSWPPTSDIDDLRIAGLIQGLELNSELADVSLVPWRPAVDLPRSTREGSLIRVPTPCGKHTIFYPQELFAAAINGNFCAFASCCECDKAYLVRTQADGAHFKAEGTLEAISQIYEDLAGDEFSIDSPAGTFIFKVTS